MKTIHIGVTGNRRKITDCQIFVFGYLLGKMTDGQHRFVIHHGDCIGADTTIAELCEDNGFEVIVHPPDDPKHRGFNGTRRNVIAVRDEKPPLVRNHDIVDESFMLIAFPDGPERLRSGTWSTVRYAARVGKPVAVIYPDGRVENR